MNFSVRDNGNAGSSEDGGCYVGTIYMAKLVSAQRKKKFTCNRGNRVAGLTFTKCTITNMKHEEIPVGYNNRWWERSADYNPDCDYEKRPNAVALHANLEIKGRKQTVLEIHLKRIRL